MNHYLLTARSITHAQQMAAILERSGVFARVRRSGTGLIKSGCGYTLEVAEKQYQRAVAVLQKAGREPIHTFHVINGEAKEVAP